MSDVVPCVLKKSHRNISGDRLGFPIYVGLSDRHLLLLRHYYWKLFYGSKPLHVHILIKDAYTQ